MPPLAVRVVLNALLMGSIPIWIRLSSASSYLIGFSRLTLGALLTWLVFRKRVELSAALRESPVATTALGLCFAVHWYTYFEAIQRTSATLGLLSLSTFGLHVSWMSFAFGTRRATRFEWLGIALSALGAWTAAPSLRGQAEIWLGFGLGMTSALFYAAVPHLHQRLSHHTHATRSTAQLGIAWCCFVPFVPSMNFQLEAFDWLILGMLGVFCTFIAHNLWISITTEVPPATSGILYYLTIPVTMFLDWLVFGRPVLPSHLLGAGLILAGHWLARRGKAESKVADSRAVDA